MPCDPSIFEEVPIFSLLDADERAVLSEQVELRRFAPRHRIYKSGDPGGKAFIVVKGQVEVAVIDEDNQEVVLDRPAAGEMFGLASMLAASPHATTATAVEDTTAIEIDRHDLTNLLQRKPLAGLDMLTTVGRHFQAAQELVRSRAARNPNEVIAEQLTVGDRLADGVARFGGSWTFIICFGAFLVLWMGLNTALVFAQPPDPYPYIFLNLILSCIAALQAPIIMMSQNRQAAKDRVAADQDFQVNIKAEFAIQQLHRKVDDLRASLAQHRRVAALERRETQA